MIVAARAGFTLIEVLVSMALFAIGMLAVAGMFMLQTRGNTFGGGLTVANDLAIQQIERIMNINSSVNSATTVPVAVTAAQLNTAVGAGAGVAVLLNEDGSVPCTAGVSPPCYSRIVTYPNGVGGGPNGTTPVLVRVRWTDQIGAAHTVTMATQKW